MDKPSELNIVNNSENTTARNPISWPTKGTSAITNSENESDPKAAVQKIVRVARKDEIRKPDAHVAARNRKTQAQK